jgi:hypothetical protein
VDEREQQGSEHIAQMSILTKIYAVRDNGFVRYVGKTVKPLEIRLAEHMKSARDGQMFHKCCGIRKVLNEGRLPTITLLEVASGNGNKEEMAWIAYFRGYGIKLWNETAGGDGIKWPSKEICEKRRDTRKTNGIPYQTPASIAKISATLVGHVVPESVREKIRAKLKGRLPWNTGKHTCLLGVAKTEEHKRKIGLGNKGKIRTEVMRQAISERQRGIIHSPEHKAKISTGLRVAYATGRRK